MDVTENWDDDFEFNPNSPPRKPKNNNQNHGRGANDDFGQTRMSTTSSRFTIDWDAEVGASPDASPVNTVTSSTSRPKVFTAPNLAEWAEPGPSTPAKRRSHPFQGGTGVGLVTGTLGGAVVTENWDDDFEDNADTPIRRLRGEQQQASPTKEITRNFRSMQPLNKNEARDNDRPVTPGRNRASSSASVQAYSSRAKYVSYSGYEEEREGEEEDDEEEEFGFMDKDDKDEDKTLTGRSSRRAALGRLNSLTNRPLNLTPPPPVPTLPSHLTGLAGGGSITRDRENPEPFPRSPSSSVFSLPTTIAGDSVNYGSTAYLHPIASRTSSSGGGHSGQQATTHNHASRSTRFFAHLPPSPPIHKERERRRLRKKSRPPPQGMFELVPVETYSSNLAALHEVENRERDRDRSPGRDSTRSSADHSSSHHSNSNSRPRTPQTPQTPASATAPTSPPPTSPGPANVNLTNTPSSKRHSTSSNPPATPSGSTKAALLSRIGSVKKWGVKGISRKRGASVSQPAELQDGSMGPPDAPPRPTSSLSSLPSSAHTHPSQPSSRAVSPPTAHHPSNRSNSNWFFRNSDTFTTASGASASASVESAPGYGYSYSPYSHGYHPRGGGGGTDLRGSKTDLGGSRTDVRGSTTDLHPRSHSRRRSYDTNGIVRSACSPQRVVERKRSQSQTRSRNRRPKTQESQVSSFGDKEHGKEQNSEKEKELATPSKLLKRKSLGFVQLRRTISSLGNGNGDSGGGASDSSKGGSPAGQARHASYGGARRATVAAKGDVFQDRQNLNLADPPIPLVHDGRGRKKSLSVVKAKAKQDEEDKPDKKELGNGFMRSVRKISIVGRHRREKSATVVVPTAAVAASPTTTAVVPETVESSNFGSRPEDTKDAKGTHDTPNTNESKEKAINESKPQDAPPSHHTLCSSSPEPANTRASVDIEATAQEEEIGADTKPPLPQTPRKASKPLSNPSTPPSSPKRTTPATSPVSPTSPSRGPASPQTASLGRSTYSPTRTSPDEKAVPRRSSLGDLKIPARISQAQVGLRRDLGMVKEFAHNIEQLRELQNTYHYLVVDIQGLLDSHAQLHAQQHVVRSVSPSFFSRPVGRKRSNTNPGPTPDPGRQLAYKQLASAFYTINSKYRITWECAELLIELGGGSSLPGPSTSVSAPAGVQANSADEGSSLTRRKGRERAITLACDESKPPSPLPGMKSPLDVPDGIAPSGSIWRAPAGRQELSQRQMILLKELLNNADSSFITEDVTVPIPEESLAVNKEWKWGDPSNSTITLPPSESSGGPSSTSSIAPNNKKSRTSRLGMAGLRDLLKMLKRHHTAHPAHPMRSFGSIPQSTSSLATSTTNSSSDLHLGRPPVSDLRHPDGEKAATYGRRRAKTSLGPEMVPTLSMYDSTPLPTRQSRGRPSLASIFRIPNSFKPHKVSGSHSARLDDADDGKTKDATGGSSSPADEDWDQIDSSTDLDKAAKAPGAGVGADGMATVRGRGRSPYLQQPPPSSFNNGGRTSPRPKRNASSSQMSLYEDSPPSSSHNVQARPSSKGSGQTPFSHPSSHSSYANANSHVTPLMPSPKVSSRYSSSVTNALKNGSVRSMPPQPIAELRLAMTPENIKPLVENAKEVHIRLVECVSEIRALLESHKSSTINEPPATGT